MTNKKIKERNEEVKKEILTWIIILLLIFVFIHFWVYLDKEAESKDRDAFEARLRGYYGFQELYD